jgi:putative transposase
VKGFGWNHQRVYRIYRELELNLRIKPRKRLVRQAPKPLIVPASAKEVWSMDFMHDQLKGRRSIRLFDVIDDLIGSIRHRDRLLVTCPCPGLWSRSIRWRGRPMAIRCDNGPEYLSDEITQWAARHGIALNYIQPGKPQQNAYVERFQSDGAL